jgi:N-acetylglutamate synthase-like GNAT family acetyltransferase
MIGVEIRPAGTADSEWIKSLLEAHWSSVQIVTRGRTHLADRLPGFIATQEGTRVGLITYCIDAEQCEIVTLNSTVERIGVGSALVDAVTNAAASAQCRRVWLITTNDNVDALRFYQKRGFALAAIHRNAIEYSRRIKPEIPPLGMHGIPLRDEIELELLL